MIVALFAGLDIHIQIVLRRRQRTSGERSEGARRILGLVKIKHRFAVHRFLGVKKASRLVSLCSRSTDHER